MHRHAEPRGVQQRSVLRWQRGLQSDHRVRCRNAGELRRRRVVHDRRVQRDARPVHVHAGQRVLQQRSLLRRHGDLQPDQQLRGRPGGELRRRRRVYDGYLQRVRGHVPEHAEPRGLQRRALLHRRRGLRSDPRLSAGHHGRLQRLECVYHRHLRRSRRHVRGGRHLLRQRCGRRRRGVRRRQSRRRRRLRLELHLHGLRQRDRDAGRGVRVHGDLRQPDR